jgi:hypothetical protein
MDMPASFVTTIGCETEWFGLSKKVPAAIAGTMSVSVAPPPPGGTPPSDADNAQAVLELEAMTTRGPVDWKIVVAVGAGKPFSAPLSIVAALAMHPEDTAPSTG